MKNTIAILILLLTGLPQAGIAEEASLSSKLNAVFAQQFQVNQHDLMLAEHGDIDKQYQAYMHYKLQPASAEQTAQMEKWKTRITLGGHKEILIPIYAKNDTTAFLKQQGYTTSDNQQGIIEFHLANGLIQNNQYLIRAEELLNIAKKLNIKGADEALNKLNPRQLGVEFYQRAMIHAQQLQASDNQFHTKVVNRLKRASDLDIIEANIALAQVYANPQYQFASQTMVLLYTDKAADKGNIDAQLQSGRIYLAMGVIEKADHYLNMAFDGIIVQGKKPLLKQHVLPMLKQTPIGSQLSAERRRELDDVQRQGYALIEKLSYKAN